MWKALLIGCIVACTGCATQRMVRTELYFGLNKQHGGQVSEAEWTAFVDTVLTRTFTEGMTTVDAHGHWYDPTEDRMESEPSHVVIAVHPRARTTDAMIDTVRAKYCRYFDQYAVLRLDARVRMR